MKCQVMLPPCLAGLIHRPKQRHGRAIGADIEALQHRYILAEALIVDRQEDDAQQRDEATDREQRETSRDREACEPVGIRMSTMCRRHGAFRGLCRFRGSRRRRLSGGGSNLRQRGLPEGKKA